MAFAALLDTCVLVPSLQRDVLLQCAAAGVYRPLWSSGILTELEDVLSRLLTASGRPEVEVSAYVGRLRSQMAEAFPDAVVTGWEQLEGSIKTTDPDDAHVVAAAVMGSANVIVSDDLRGFRYLPGGLPVQTTDVFLLNALDLQPDTVVQAIQAVAARTGRHGPRRTAREIVDLLSERNTPGFGAAAAAKLPS